MPDYDYAKIFQVLSRQARQQRFVDRILPKSCLILFEPEFPQPPFEIHDGALPPPASMIVHAQRVQATDIGSWTQSRPPSSEWRTAHDFRGVGPAREAGMPEGGSRTVVIRGAIATGSHSIASAVSSRTHFQLAAPR